MLVPALRRFVQLLVVLAALTVVLASILGLLLGASILRSITLGFYLVGCALLIGGFFFGNRGPVRPRRDVDAGGEFARLASRRLRWATREEHEETINLSAVYVCLGLALVLLGVVSDTRHPLF